MYRILLIIFVFSVGSIYTYGQQQELNLEKRPPLFAIKTNMLFDALLMPNIEIEVPIGNQWSVAGEWISSWWIWDNDRADSKRHRMQLLYAGFEGRYWFHTQIPQTYLNGWFIGVYVGGGLYDFEYSAKGYQGEFMILGGISLGYSHTINKEGSLKLEYSVGLGCMQTNYRYYEAFYSKEHICEVPGEHNWHPIKREISEFSWFGPTKLRISLGWMINKKQVNEK